MAVSRCNAGEERVESNALAARFVLVSRTIAVCFFTRSINVADLRYTPLRVRDRGPKGEDALKVRGSCGFVRQHKSPAAEGGDAQGTTSRGIAIESAAARPLARNGLRLPPRPEANAIGDEHDARDH